MKQVSFHYTQDSYKSGSKNVTRRLSWGVKPGEHFMGVKQMQGLKKGERRTLLGESICVSVTLERLDEIIKHPIRRTELINNPSLNVLDPDVLNIRTEMDREGGPVYTPAQYVDLFKRINKRAGVELNDDTIIKRVVFRRVFHNAQKPGEIPEGMRDLIEYPEAEYFIPSEEKKRLADTWQKQGKI